MTNPSIEKQLVDKARELASLIGALSDADNAARNLAKRAAFIQQIECDAESVSVSHDMLLCVATRMAAWAEQVFKLCGEFDRLSLDK